MNQHKDSRTITTPRIATISRNGTGAIGVCIFLTTAELRKLGVDPTQADAIEYKLVQMNSQLTLGITESADSAVTGARDSITD